MKAELRLFLLRNCLVNPPPPPAPAAARAMPAALAAVVPKLVEVGLGGIATLLKKAGTEETEQATASEVADFYRTDVNQQLAVNDEIRCVLAVYGTFAEAEGRRNDRDAAVRALEDAGLVPRGADIAIVFEAMVVPTSDETAFYLETRHFSVRDFIGDRRKPDRVYVATLSIGTPDATADGSTIALGNVALGRLGKETLPIPSGGALGTYPRYRSNLMPWNRITADAKEVYESDVKRDKAKNKSYMPVTFALTLSETADGNKFLAALGGLLEGAKADAARELGNLFLPQAGKQDVKEKEDAAEALYQAEEDALIAEKEAEAELTAGTPEQHDVLAAKLAKAARAHERAVRLRRAAGLPDLPA